ncbi:MAG: YfhO family protein [Methylacidiphilales bacterium]|nr:YfhO family protein [Candidatus Methylacidiphilales bacterium]
MDSPASSPAPQGRWTSLWVVTLISLAAQLWLCRFFTFGQEVPYTIDVNPSNLWKMAYHFPPSGLFSVLNWLGVAYLPQALNPYSLAAHWPAWWFFTAYTPLMATLSLLTMAAFLRELEVPRPAALFGGIIYAWQGDLLPFVFPGHFGYIATWPFFALAAWGALRARRTRHWAFALISGASCGLMVEMQTDRGALASLLIAALYASAGRNQSDTRQRITDYLRDVRHLALCALTALLIALATLIALFQSNVEGARLGGQSSEEENYKLVTQYSLGPAETVTYLVPGFFGWHINSVEGPYWGQIGQTLDWPQNPNSTRNSNLAISTTGTIATALALIGVLLLLPGRLLGPNPLSPRQIFYGRLLLALGFITLIFSWGWHTSIYHLVYALPLMDKWRNPLKWLEMTNFALVTLSSFGMQHLLASLAAEESLTATIRRRLSWFCGILLTLLGLGLLASYPYSAFVLPIKLQREGYEPLAVANIMSTLHTSLQFAVVLVALLCLILAAAWKPERLRKTTLPNPFLDRLWQRIFDPKHLALSLTLSTALLAVLQLGWVVTKFIEPISLEMMTMSNPLLEKLKSEGDTVRVSVAAEDPALNLLLLNQFSASNISCLDISAASRIPNDINTFFQTLDNNHPRLWLLAGVKNVVVPQQFITQMHNDPAMAADMDHVDGYVLQPTGSPDLPSHALIQIKDYLAKATLVPQAEFFTSDDALLKRLADPAWNPLGSVLLSPDHKLMASGSPAGDPASDHLDLQTYTPTDIDIDLQSSTGGFVLVNDQYNPDWQVEVNGRPAQLLRADYIMRAVQVQPGHSTISMHYAARYNLVGLPVEWVNNFSDGVMIAAWIIAGFALWRRRTSAPSAS